MPTIFRKDGFSFRIYFNDHSPAHVHVVKAGGQAKISLETEIPELLLVENMPRQTVRKALKLALEYQAELLKKWREMYG